MAQAGIAYRPAYFVYHRLWRILDYIYPPRCITCGRTGRQWCLECQKDVTLIEGIICERCGEPQASPGVCPRCRNNPPGYRSLRSYGVFEGGLREAIHSLKYHQNMSMGEHLSHLIVQALSGNAWDIDLIVSVPLGKERRRERGYNQSSLLAFPVALAFGIPFKAGALYRKHETSSQVTLSAAERLRNVMGAFVAHPGLVEGKSVLVIDDVTTTGATMAACAQALLSAGAREVYGFTLARAVHGMKAQHLQP